MQNASCGKHWNSIGWIIANKHRPFGFVMTENFTPADLIYLYLDGEADSMQQTTMFAALASDPDLQQEFSEALSMRRAFEFERSSAKPPLYLSTRVFQDAGILPKAVGVGALGGGLWLWLRKAAVPVGTLLLGSVVTFFAMNLLSPSRTLPTTQRAEQIPSASSQPTISSSTQQAYDQSAGTTGSAATSHVRSVSYVRDRGLHELRTSDNHQSASSGYVSPPSATNQNALNVSPQNSTENDALDGTEGFISRQTRIASAQAYEANPYARKLDMVYVPLSNINVGKTSDFSVQINMAGANIAGVVPGSTNPSFLSDIAGTVLYQIDEKNALGFGMSSVRHNISDNTNNGSLQNPRLTTWTVEYQRISADALLLGGQGYLSLGVGPSWNSGTMMGVGDVNLGLSFPIAFLRLNTGFNVQSVWYQSQSNGLSTNVKSSFILGLGYNW